MSIGYSGTLLSATGSKALSNLATSTVDHKYYGQINNLSILNNISSGFNSGSIFGNSSGIASSYNNSDNYLSLTSHNYTSRTLDAGLLPGGGRCSTDQKLCMSMSGGTSIIGNYFNSISNVALGQQAPTSVFEQRLNLAGIQTNKPGSMLGNFNNFNDIDAASSVSNNYKASSGSKTVSGLMSLLA